MDPFLTKNSMPMNPETIHMRYKTRQTPRYGIRLVPNKEFDPEGFLGKKERKYVCVGDYEEQQGRTLKEVLCNLNMWILLSKKELLWSAIIFKIKQNSVNFDVFPVTWKAVFFILVDKKRLGLFKPTEEEISQLEKEPNDFYEDNQQYWFSCLAKYIPKCQNYTVEELLTNYFGIYDPNYEGEGLTYIKNEYPLTMPSRVFLVKNLPLSSMKYSIKELGHTSNIFKV